MARLWSDARLRLAGVAGGLGWTALSLLTFAADRTPFIFRGFAHEP